MNLSIMIFRKKELVLIFTILVAGAIGFFGFNYNYGYLNVNSLISDYTLIVGKTKVDCQLNPCKVKLSPKNYSILIQKNGYNDFESRIEILRGATSDLDYSPVIKAGFKPFAGAVSPLFKAEILSSQNQTQYLVNSELVTTFPNRLSSEYKAIVSSDGYKGLVYSEQDLPQIYLIDIATKSKELINLEIDFLPTAIGFLTQNALLLQDDQAVYTYSLDSQAIAGFPIVSVEHLVCFSKEDCIFISPFDVSGVVQNVKSDLNLFADIVTNQGLDFLSKQDLSYKLYLFNQVNYSVNLMANLPEYIKDPVALVLSIKAQNQLGKFIKSSAGKYYEITF